MHVFKVHKFNADIKAGGWKLSVAPETQEHWMFGTVQCCIYSEQVQIHCAWVLGRPDAGG